MTTCHILVANVFFAPFTYGGATVIAEEVAKALLRRTSGHLSYKITAVSLCCHSDLADYTMIKSERDGIRNYVINVPATRNYAQMYANDTVTRMIADLMDDLRPDLVHAHCIQDMGTGVLQAAQDRAIPSILSVHDFWWLCERQFMIRPDQTYCNQTSVKIDGCRKCVVDFEAAKMRFDHLQNMSRLPVRVTYPSQFAHDLSITSGFAPDRGIVWENGVQMPSGDFACKQAERRRCDPRMTFGFVGGASQIKGWPVIREAFKTIGCDDFRVVLVDGSPDGDWWRDHCFDDLPGVWEICPRFDQAQMDGFYSEIDALLFMSQWKETFGLALREALARGIDVIQTDSGGSVEHGAVEQADLIPIGAPASVLRNRLVQAIAQHPKARAPWPVVNHDAQAAAFDEIVQDVLAMTA